MQRTAGVAHRKSRHRQLARADVAFYGLSVTITVGGLLLQLLSSGARAKGIGVIVVVLGVFLGLTRLLLQRLALFSSGVSGRFDKLERSLRMSTAPYEEDTELSPVAATLWDRAVDAHEQVREALAGGSMVVNGTDATIRYLRLLTEEAVHTMHAVDHVDPMRWLTDYQLMDYLNFQLERVQNDGVALERIRIVSNADLEKRESVDALERLVELHESAGARMLLCPEDAARELRTDFFPAKGALIIDRGLRGACLTGRLGGQGFIENGIVHLKLVGPARTTADEYQLLVECVASRGLDVAVRSRLPGLGGPLPTK
jgi:hypothetical protein